MHIYIYIYIYIYIRAYLKPECLSAAKIIQRPKPLESDSHGADVKRHTFTHMHMNTCIYTQIPPTISTSTHAQLQAPIMHMPNLITRFHYYSQNPRGVRHLRVRQPRGGQEPHEALDICQQCSQQARLALKRKAGGTMCLLLPC
jgi:hypothetical protein